MVELEPVLLPQSTSLKTRIWVSQAQPCQEQPALFGSLERLPGQNAPNNHSKAPHQAATGTWHTPLPITLIFRSGSKSPGLLLSSSPVRVNHSHCFLDNIMVYTVLAFPLYHEDILGQWRHLLFAVLQFSVKDAKWNIQVSWCFEPDHVKTKENLCSLALRTGVTTTS